MGSYLGGDPVVESVQSSLKVGKGIAAPARLNMSSRILQTSARTLSNIGVSSGSVIVKDSAAAPGAGVMVACTGPQLASPAGL